MHAKTTFVLGLLLVLGATPVSNAAHQPNGTCVNQESVHTYSEALRALVTHPGPIGIKKHMVATPGAIDGCMLFRGDYDGETEAGVSGGRFAAGTRGENCDWVATSHHAYGEGAQYWADDGTGLAWIIYWAGADGPAWLQITGCETDGIITDNPWTDPYDCGSGDIGTSGFPWTPATLHTNGYAGACNPFDGFVWVFIWTGVDVRTGSISTPIMGHIWS